MKEELLKGLTKEQIAKVRECKNHEELLAMAKEEGIELTDEQLTAISGGGICQSTPNFTCPMCNSSKIKSRYVESNMSTWYSNDCQECGYHWAAKA